MSLSSGTQLGPYEIQALIGAGGMGEVYRARDSRLQRTVAIKVLAEHVSAKLELKQRFEREAQTIAGLNHPHICVVYDVGHQDGRDYLVMEFLEGQTLAERLERGPLPQDEAVKYATEIADALEKAHRHGVVHRDLKPGNIMLTASGPKLLDFGLAKLRTVESGAAPVTASAMPTDARNLTAAGTLLGTLQYMSPEQLEGKEADARSDIFAFGATLYEMLTGKKAFEGKSQVSLMAAILEHEPKPVSAIQPSIPRGVERLLQICLAKNPEDRLQTAREVLRELTWIVENPVSAEIPAARARSSSLSWVAVLVLLIFGAVGFVYWTRQTLPLPVVRFPIFPADGTTYAAATPRMSISPDGTQLVFAATREGMAQLWVRRLDSVESRVLSGTEGAQHTFWSPDSRFIGFFADQKLKVIEAAGGPVRVLSDGPNNNAEGTWNRDGIILFGGSNPDSAIRRVSADGGIDTPVLELDPKHTMHLWPRFLPDERHFIFFAVGKKPEDTGVYVASLDGGEPALLLASPYMAAYAEPGYLLFRLDEALMARPFDPERRAFTGEPTLIAPTVGTVGGNGRVGFTVSANGYLAYAEGTPGGAFNRLGWLDRNGKELGNIGNAGNQDDIRLSPDGKQLVMHVGTPGGGRDLWVHDLIRGVSSRLTFDPRNDVAPVWSPDGQAIVFASNRTGVNNIYKKSASGLGQDELVLKSDLGVQPNHWSADGKLLLFSKNMGAGNRDIHVLPLTEKATPTEVQTSPFDEVQGQFSPDGRAIAFATNESGRYQVNVRSFPGNERKIQVSTEGGLQPRWRSDGKELFFINGDGKLMAVPMKSSLEPGVPVPLFQTPLSGTVPSASSGYVTSADGKRFVFVLPETISGDNPIIVIQNWTAGLRK